MGKETVEEEQEDENQMTENMKFFSEVVLWILVILSFCIWEAPPVFIHVKINAVARQAFYFLLQSYATEEASEQQQQQRQR